MKYPVSHEKMRDLIEKVMKDTERLETTNVVFSKDSIYGKVIEMYIERATGDLIVISEE